MDGRMIFDISFTSTFRTTVIDTLSLFKLCALRAFLSVVAWMVQFHMCRIQCASVLWACFISPGSLSGLDQ